MSPRKKGKRCALDGAFELSAEQYEALYGSDSSRPHKFTVGGGVMQNPVSSSTSLSSSPKNANRNNQNIGSEDTDEATKHYDRSLVIEFAPARFRMAGSVTLCLMLFVTWCLHATTVFSWRGTDSIFNVESNRDGWLRLRHALGGRYSILEIFTTTPAIYVTPLF